MKRFATLVTGGVGSCPATVTTPRELGSCLELEPGWQIDTRALLSLNALILEYPNCSSWAISVDGRNYSITITPRHPKPLNKPDFTNLKQDAASYIKAPGMSMHPDSMLASLGEEALKAIYGNDITRYLGWDE